MDSNDLTSLINSRFDAMEARFSGVEQTMKDQKEWRCPNIIQVETLMAEKEKEEKRLHVVLALWLSLLTLLSRAWKLPWSH